MDLSRARWLAVLCLLGIILTACGGSFSETIRYRLTFNVDVDGSLVSGSGVIQVKQSDMRALFGSMGGTGSEVNGEAVIVNLGPRGTLFALLRGQSVGFRTLGGPAWLLFHAFADVHKREAEPLPKVQLLKEQRPRRVLRVDEIPMLVHFRDLDDPKSVEQVEPANLAAAFGPGVALREAVIEVTDDPVTVGIENKLPWLKKLNGQLDGDRLHHGATLSNDLNRYDFYQRYN
ncbi:hypothetical protein JQ617_02600 [Bradyrhizobium sp. KB893862 SZCCT0404]|uniref:hypothetical protein n=1 Tax=Bradyrhizobium sp. KB893862 SZCCT0404 TaxID=2807672 RepID=UPI001BA88EF4|nr:hypothetical protein [Bradyrhizobium sp. KB893862 SZCCT0404]MBR1172833.1 hypothetical protein [Bradyrhizobium sp. KB893862 SZCCT0404]